MTATSADAAAHLPSFSVIVPTYNRPQKLTECVGALSRLDYPHDRFEVIIVDDGTDPASLVESAVAPFDGSVALRLITQERKGPAEARNLGASGSSADYLAFTDDDCAPRSDWLAQLSAHFARSPDSIAGGRTENALQGNLCSSASQALVTYLCDYYRNVKRPFYASNNLALPGALFREIGGFDTRFPFPGGEDREFCDRLHHLGHRLEYAHDAVVDHYHALTLAKFLRQHFNYGRGAYFYHAIRIATGRAKRTIEPASFYIDLLRAPLRGKNLERRFLLVALLCLSQGANAAGYFRERFRGDPPRPANQATE